MRILLVFPIFQAVYPRAFHNFAELLITAARNERTKDVKFGVMVQERKSLVAAMNEAAETLIEQGFDAMIMFDDDCFPPIDAIPRLVAHCVEGGHPFVAGLGVMRGYPFTTTAAKYYPEGITASYDEKGKLRLAGFEWLDDFPAELTPVDFCGVPIAMVMRECFERVEFPWFADLDEQGRRMTHDVYFCRKLKDAGIPVMVDGTMRCGHMSEAPIITFENRPQARADLT